MKFTAAILTEHNKELDIEELSINNKLSYGQVLIKMISTGICGKQIEEIKGKMGDDKYIPHLLGHEGYGIVVDFGPGVKKVKKDDYVILHWIKGEGIQCETPTYYMGSRSINAGWITTFNTYSIISENRMTVVNKQDDDISAPLFGCAVPTGIGTVLNQANARPEHKIAVIGAGGVGLNCIMGSKVINSKEIICYEEKIEARKLAITLGANEVVPLEYDKYKDFDIVLDTVASTKTLEKAFSITKYNGDIYVIGVPSPGISVNINALNLHRNIRFNGSSGGNIIPEIHIPAYMRLNENNIINVKKCVTKVGEFLEINEAINRIIKGKETGRVVLKF